MSEKSEDKKSKPARRPQKRQIYLKGHKRKFLVVVDETPECESALAFAASRAERTKGQLALLYVIEPEDGAMHWLGVEEIAREDVAGFETYAERIAGMFRVDDKPCGQDSVLCDLMEGLFHIAAADGDYHPAEDAFLSRVAEIFGMERPAYERMRARYAPDYGPDPYTVLGVSPEASLEDIRAAWRAEVRETHPDRMIARGVPEEAVRLAERRMQAINRAWEEIQAGRAT